MVVEMLTERVGVIPGGVNVGVILGDDGGCTLVDAGINESAGKKAIRAVRDDLGRDITAILVTHGHADHYGANAAIVKRTAARVLAPEVDEAFLRYPLLQPISLFAGADPPESLRGGFLLADPSPVDEIVTGPEVTVGGVPVQVIPLRGHSPNQVGYLVEGIFFCADVVLPETVLEKYRIPYLFSVSEHLEALRVAEQVNCSIAVPGHGPRVESLQPLVDLNRGLVMRVIEVMLEGMTDPVLPEVVLRHVLREMEAPVADDPSYYLLHPTIYAFLSHLLREGRVRSWVDGGESLWQRVAN